MSYRLAVALACVCTSAACLKAPPFGGIGGDDGGPGDDSGDGNVTNPSLAEWAYLKAAVPGSADHFGTSVAISGSGSTLAVGASDEDGSGRGINGTVDTEALDAGAVNVFIATGDTWMQQAYVKASNADAEDQFGSAMALSEDGDTLAVGAPMEDSPSVTMPTMNTSKEAGAVYVFARAGGGWTQQAFVKSSVSTSGDKFGTSVALSADGTVLVVGAPSDDTMASDSGAAYVFRGTGTTWTLSQILKADSPSMGDEFGTSVAISGDGSTIAIGSPAEDSDTTGINSTPNKNGPGGIGSGAAYVFRFTGATGMPWALQAYVKPSNTSMNEDFGRSVALSRDGNVLAAGAPGDSSDSTGVGGSDTPGGATRSGAVFVFARTDSSVGGTWSQSTYIKASNAEGTDQFGAALALARSGATLLVGATWEGSSATGIDGAQTNDLSIGMAGAAYLFENTSTWQQTAYIKASNTGMNDYFGAAVALADVARTFAVAATYQDGSGTPTDSGAVYVFRDPE